MIIVSLSNTRNVIPYLEKKRSKKGRREKKMRRENKAGNWEKQIREKRRGENREQRGYTDR